MYVLYFYLYQLGANLQIGYQNKGTKKISIFLAFLSLHPNAQIQKVPNFKIPKSRVHSATRSKPQSYKTYFTPTSLASA